MFLAEGDNYCKDSYSKCLTNVCSLNMKTQFETNIFTFPHIWFHCEKSSCSRLKQKVLKHWSGWTKMELSSSLIQTRHTEGEVQFWVKRNVDRGLVITFRVWAHLWASGIQGRDQHQRSLASASEWGSWRELIAVNRGTTDSRSPGSHDLIGPSPARWMVLFEPQPHAHENRHRHGQMKGLAVLGALGDSILASLGGTFTGHRREEADSIQKAHPPLCGHI